MNDDFLVTKNRKIEHIEISLKYNIEGPLSTWFEYVYLIHQANPELDLDEINLEVRVFGRKLKAPLLISGMTGGHPKTLEINAALAEVAEEFGIGIGVGSQRAMIEDSTVTNTYAIVRKKAPTTFVIANIGAAQLARGDVDIKDIKRIVEVISADALAIHLNAAQEIVQPEGQPSFRNIRKYVAKIIEKIEIPIIIKEIGCGLSLEVVKSFSELGVQGFDVAGAGGTNWILIEKFRAELHKEHNKLDIASTFLKWGIPTAASIIETRYAAPNALVIGSGGLRSGLDVAKAIALGADMGGLALPILKAYFNKNLRNYVSKIINELRIAMFLTGSKTVANLRKAPLVLLNPLKNWIECRGIEFKKYLVIKSTSCNV